MILGTDGTSKVCLVVDGIDPSTMPTEWNGGPITPHVLTDEQRAAYDALPSNRGGTTFDGESFVSLPEPPPPQPDNAAAMVARQRADAIDALDSMISKLPSAQQEPLRLIQQLLKD